MRVRVDRLILAGGLLLLGIGGVIGWRLLRPPPREADLGARLDDFEGRRRPSAGSSARSAQPAAPRFIRPFASGSTSREEFGEGIPVFVPPPSDDPGAPSSDEAVEAYQATLADLEAAVARGGKLDVRQRDDLYRRASGSLTALSVWVDQSDPGQRALLEDAYQQMKSLMRELELDPAPYDHERYIPADQR